MQDLAKANKLLFDAAYHTLELLEMLSGNIPENLQDDYDMTFKELSEAISAVQKLQIDPGC